MKQKLLITLTVLMTGIAIASEPAASQDLTRSQLPTRATVYSYNWQGKNATTLYLRNIPILTFFAENGGEIAQKLAERLNQINAADANKITVRWNDRHNSYDIVLDTQKLVTVNSTTILPDTTANLALDALQATNRLRRLLGNAAPLNNITGRQLKTAPKIAKTREIRGIASWYGPGFHGRTTASGERYNSNALTAAHRSLPFGTKVKVTNLNNGRVVVVRINDRGPYAGRRIIDLSAAAARRLKMVKSGVAPVKIEILAR